MFIGLLCITARQPVGLAVLTQLQAGLDAVLRLALQQFYLVLLQRLRHRLAERRQAHGVLMPPCLHKRQVGVIEIAAWVHRPDIGVADKQPGLGAERSQVAAEVDQRVGAALDFQHFS